MSDKESSSALDTRARIVALCDGRMEPLFGSVYEGPDSPSSSLLIERHEICASSNWRTVVIPDQVLTLQLHRCVVEVGDESGCRYKSRVRGSVVIEKRACEQTIRWITPAAVLAVRISDTALEQAAEAAAYATDTMPDDRTIRDMRLSSLMYALERERLNGFPSGRLFLDGIEQALAAMVVRYEGVARRHQFVHKGGLTPYRMRRVTEFIQEHIEEDITLNELARNVGLSPSHFCNLFHKTSGKTPHQFILHCRIQHAKALLAKQSNSILDVALASGFRTHQHFSRIFRRHVGIPPSAYRGQL
jgi:AraC family transcriptional regulator